jgi:hypothetical protein
MGIPLDGSEVEEKSSEEYHRIGARIKNAVGRIVGDLFYNAGSLPDVGDEGELGEIVEKTGQAGGFANEAERHGELK